MTFFCPNPPVLCAVHRTPFPKDRLNSKLPTKFSGVPTDWGKIDLWQPVCRWQRVTSWRTRTSAGLLGLHARCWGLASDEVCLRSTEGFSEKELSLGAQSRGGGYEFPSQSRRGNGFRDGCHTDPFHCPTPPLISTNPSPLAFQSLNFTLPVPFSSCLSPSHCHMEVIWELYGRLKGCVVEPRATFLCSTSASFPLLFNPPIFFLSCFYVKELRWQTKRGLSPAFAQPFPSLPEALRPSILTWFSRGAGEAMWRNLEGNFPEAVAVPLLGRAGANELPACCQPGSSLMKPGR